MIKINTCFDSIIWTDLPEVLTYSDITEALNQKLTDNPAKNRHLRKIAFFVTLLKSGKEFEDNMIQLMIEDKKICVGDGNHRLAAFEYHKSLQNN